ncbi:MAG: septal ring lytic transglycosylase RlpA family protein [Pseudomonadota bacterium]
MRILPVAMTSTQLPSSLLLSFFLAAQAGPAAAAPDVPARHKSKAASPKKDHQSHLDRSGKTRMGKASIYSRGLYGKKMANGEKMRPESNHAASKTLPLGTTARVTSVETGKSDVVEITDRGPYVSGRIIDVSPQTAKDLDFKREGVTRVKVKPLHIPKPGDDEPQGARK